MGDYSSGQLIPSFVVGSFHVLLGFRSSRKLMESPPKSLDLVDHTHHRKPDYVDNGQDELYSLQLHELERRPLNDPPRIERILYPLYPDDGRRL